jgi:hypothetical protein
MKAFYFDRSTQQSVPSESPIELDHENCRLILNKLRTEGSFIGIILDENSVLQIMCEPGGLFWLEILDQRTRITNGCVVNLPIAESALEAASAAKPVRDALAEHFLDWKLERV